MTNQPTLQKLDFFPQYANKIQGETPRKSCHKLAPLLQKVPQNITQIIYMKYVIFVINQT